MSRARFRVLVVDDDDAVRRSVGRLLGMCHEIDTADGAAAARRLLSRHSYDAVLCDVTMPGETGLDLYASLDAATAKRVLFMTGGVVDAALLDRLQRTGRPVLLKPVPFLELEAAIGEVIRRAAHGRGP